MYNEMIAYVDSIHKELMALENLIYRSLKELGEEIDFLRRKMSEIEEKFCLTKSENSCKIQGGVGEE